VNKRYNRQVEKHIVNQYEVLGKEAMNLPGDIADPKTLRGAYVKHFTDLYDDVYSREGHKIIRDSKLERVGTLFKGVTVGNTWKPDERKKLMIAALVGSYLAMRTDAHLEKYGTCGGGKMCLHFPKLFGDDNNEPYQQDEHLTQNYEGLVMGVLPSFTGGKTDRFHILSPCKTDLVVETHKADEGFCKCEELSLTNEVVYKLQRISCVFKEELRVAPINADGTCPKTYMWKGKEHEIDPKWDDWEIMFPCDVDEDQEECIYKEMHDDPCTDNKYDDGCLKDEYRNCYDKNGDNKCLKDELGECDSDGHCTSAFSAIGSGLNHYYPPVALSIHQDTFPAAVNLKENVNTGLLEPVTICRNSWASDFLGGASGGRDQPCVSVAYDVDSMRGYSKEGFGMNYCAENKAQFRDKLEKTCFWGGMAGAVVVSALSGGVTGTVIVPVAVGSASIACEKLAGQEGKWPHDQY
jgi:hypothetical protein